jgi:hypothetical protein
MRLDIPQRSIDQSRHFRLRDAEITHREFECREFRRIDNVAFG